MTTVTTTVTREQLLTVQARAERCGYEGDELREIMMMLAQPPRANVFSGRERRAV
jgi:hypothetical protein